jgi:glyoxylase-like metal-dependent hydrolase (beta-lactamase superfamily II)
MKVVTVTAPNPGPYTLEGTQSYVLGERIVIDPGPEIASHIEALLAAAPQLSAILVTHRHADHAPGARSLKMRTGAPIYASHGTVDDEFVDHALFDGDEIHRDGMSLRAVATPGHTAEHFCFFSSERELFTGDTVLGAGTTVIFPPDGDMGAYLSTLQKLIDLNPAVIYPGHGPPRHDAVELLQQYLDHRRLRERQIVELLAMEESDVHMLRALIYPDLDPRLTRAAELQLDAHLILLRQNGAVVSDGTIWKRTDT